MKLRGRTSPLPRCARLSPPLKREGTVQAPSTDGACTISMRIRESIEARYSVAVTTGARAPAVLLPAVGRRALDLRLELLPGPGCEGDASLPIGLFSRLQDGERRRAEGHHTGDLAGPIEQVKRDA